MQVAVDPLPFLLDLDRGLGRVAACGADRHLERPDRLGPRTLHPCRLVRAGRERQDDLRLPRADHPASHRRAQQRPRAKLPREPGHVPGRGLTHAEPLARVVAEAREPEPHEAVAPRERVERLSDGDLERAAPPRDAGEEAVHEGRGLGAGEVLPVRGGGRVERPRLRDERFRRRLERPRAIGRLAGSSHRSLTTTRP